MNLEVKKEWRPINGFHSFLIHLYRADLSYVEPSSILKFIYLCIIEALKTYLAAQARSSEKR